MKKERIPEEAAAEAATRALATACYGRELNKYPCRYQGVWTGCYYCPENKATVIGVVHKDADR